MPSPWLPYPSGDLHIGHVVRHDPFGRQSPAHADEGLQRAQTDGYVPRNSTPGHSYMYIA